MYGLYILKTVSEEAQKLDFLDKNFKINYFKYIQTTKGNHI